MKESPNRMSRRSCLKTVGGAMLVASTAASGSEPAESPFYKGTAFDPEAAKKAYFELMEEFGYPIPESFHGDDFWVCDFLQGDFARLGMGGVFWINDKGNYGEKGGGGYDGKFKDQEFGYLGHDIFLLPGQCLPEHYHLGGPEGYGPKMESWLVRHGEVEFFGEYQRAGDEVPIADLPEADRPWGAGEAWFKSKYLAKRSAKSGRVYTLEDPESHHGQRAGAKGAIVSEFATYHNHVAFAKPGMEFDNSK